MKAQAFIFLGPQLAVANTLGLALYVYMLAVANKDHAEPR